MTSPIVADMQHLADLVDFADASLRLVAADDEVTRSELLVLKDYAVAQMREIWKGVEAECCSRVVGPEKAAAIQRAGCTTLLELFGQAYLMKAGRE